MWSASQLKQGSREPSSSDLAMLVRSHDPSIKQARLVCSCCLSVMHSSVGSLMTLVMRSIKTASSELNNGLAKRKRKR